MSNRKKKKKQPCHPVVRDLEVTKSYFDKFAEVARKTLQLMELDPALYDKFSKKQKLEMMRAKMTAPRVTKQKGHSVPRQYVKMIQQEMNFFLKYSTVGNKDIGLNYGDFVTYGMTFLMYMLSMGDTKDDCTQAEYYKTIHQKARECDDKTTDHFMTCFWLYIQYLLIGLSKLNYRLYGYMWEWKELDNRAKFSGNIMLTSVPALKTHFKYNNNIRPAFRVGVGQYISEDPIYFKTPYNKLITESNDNSELDVYIQNHALSRMKERLGILTPSLRNIHFNNSLQECKVCTLSNGQLVIQYKAGPHLLGYLPFTIVDKKLFIITFLPVCSIKTPHGKKLAELLNITREEMVYFGMDKLSFFHDTDFNAIPRLKNAIVEAGLWHLTEIDVDFEYKPATALSTDTLIRYFQGEQSHKEILNEIEQKY